MRYHDVMRSYQFTDNEICHIYNRGVRKLPLFHDEEDYYRMIFYFMIFQYPAKISSSFRFRRNLELFIKSNHFITPFFAFNTNSKQINLYSFCLMENHFHISGLQKKKNGFEKYLQRVQGSYAQYYNLKYKTIGRVFESPYKVKGIHTIASALRNTAYIHRNPFIYSKDQYNNEALLKHIYDYRFSSLYDFKNGNRWGACFDEKEFLQICGMTTLGYESYLHEYVAGLPQEDIFKI